MDDSQDQSLVGGGGPSHLLEVLTPGFKPQHRGQGGLAHPQPALLAFPPRPPRSQLPTTFLLQPRASRLSQTSPDLLQAHSMPLRCTYGSLTSRAKHKCICGRFNWLNRFQNVISTTWLSAYHWLLSLKTSKQTEITHPEDGKYRQNSGILRNIWYG